MWERKHGMEKRTKFRTIARGTELSKMYNSGENQQMRNSKISQRHKKRPVECVS